MTPLALLIIVLTCALAVTLTVIILCRKRLNPQSLPYYTKKRNHSDAPQQIDLNELHQEIQIQSQLEHKLKHKQQQQQQKQQLSIHYDDQLHSSFDDSRATDLSIAHSTVMQSPEMISQSEQLDRSVSINLMPAVDVKEMQIAPMSSRSPSPLYDQRMMHASSAPLSPVGPGMGRRTSSALRIQVPEEATPPIQTTPLVGRSMMGSASGRSLSDAGYSAPQLRHSRSENSSPNPTFNQNFMLSINNGAHKRLSSNNLQSMNQTQLFMPSVRSVSSNGQQIMRRQGSSNSLNGSSAVSAATASAATVTASSDTIQTRRMIHSRIHSIFFEMQRSSPSRYHALMQQLRQLLTQHAINWPPLSVSRDTSNQIHQRLIDTVNAHFDNMTASLINHPPSTNSSSSSSSGSGLRYQRSYEAAAQAVNSYGKQLNQSNSSSRLSYANAKQI